jgi:hypothetical protein
MSEFKTIKIKHMLTLSYKNLSVELLVILSFEPLNFNSENGLILNVEKLEKLLVESTYSNEIVEEFAKIIKLMNDNNCEFLMLREG